MGDHVRAEGENKSAGFTIIEVLIVLLIVAILAAISLNIAFHAFDVSRAGRTVSDMRGITTAILKYESDHGGLPGGGLQPVADVVVATGEQMAGTIAEKDGWGHDIYYEDVVINGETTFRVYCYGKDGTPDGAVTGNYVDFYSDIVIEAGTFVQSKW
jgi:general secretion pathway protein G